MTEGAGDYLTRIVWAAIWEVGLPEHQHDDAFQTGYLEGLRVQQSAERGGQRCRTRYLFLGVKRAIIKMATRERRQRHGQVYDQSAPDPEVDPVEEKDWIEDRRQWVLGNLHHLSPGQATAIRLVLEGQTIAKVAKQMRTSRRTVYEHLHRAKNKLRGICGESES